MCDQDQTEAFVSPGYDENLHDCGICLDTGISHHIGSYCTCRMGTRIRQIDQFGLTLRDHTFPEAIRIVFTSTMRTEKSLAAAAMAILIAGHQRATKAMTDGFEGERNALLARIANLDYKLKNSEALALEMHQHIVSLDAPSGAEGEVATLAANNLNQEG